MGALNSSAKDGKKSGGGGGEPSSAKPAGLSSGGSLIPKGKVTDKGEEKVFGTGVHVGRAGNVDLSSRKLSFLGTNIVVMITEDELHRKATSLTLTDNVLYTLGKEMALLPDLEEIDMDQNRFTRLPEMLTKLPKLWRINISSNPLDPVGGFDVAPRLVALRSLTLRDCNLKAFPVRILEVETLEDLDISDNPSIDMHDMAINSMKKIRTLNVANCGLSGKNLPACIRRASGLVSLDISNNPYDFSTDVSMDFFGASIPKTLRELHLRQLHLDAVPAFVMVLTKLNSLDLAMNPIETLDVLAGRFVKKLPRIGSTGKLSHGGGSASPQSGTEPTGGRDEASPGKYSEGGDADAASIVSDSRVSTSSRISKSKISRACMVAPVSHPIPLRKLSLRACGLRTVPKYFHKMTNLEELDLSENDQLDDVNMTLFSLQNLKTLNIVGCPFAEDPSKSRNEWFDIAKLRFLRDLQWELWKGNHNMSPYRTKIPIEICGLQLRRINLVSLRRNLFVGNTVETVINLLHDGYFKVDLAVDDNTLFSHIEAVEAFAPAEDFFFPQDVRIGGAAKKGEKGSDGVLIHGEELGQAHLHIAISRYVFFLAMQAANYDAVIIPPLDVMAIHYSQVTCNPAKYRADCEAICGRILNCNYSAFFLEQKRNPQSAKDAVAASKKIWNLMVRSAQTELPWLRYDFWDRRARSTRAYDEATGTLASTARSSAPAGAAGETTATTGPAVRLQMLPREPRGTGDKDLFADFTELRSIDSVQDLGGVLDQAITSHFHEQGDWAVRATLKEFYMYNNCFRQHRDSLSLLWLDWTRYVKYLALYAYRIATSSQQDSVVVMEPMADSNGNLYTPAPVAKRTTSLLGPHYDQLQGGSFAGPADYLPRPQSQPNPYDDEAAQRRASGIARRTASGLSTASRAAQRRRESQRRSTVQHLTANPVPTIGITIMLHAHRTTPVKYFQTLSLLGIEDVDITWRDSEDIITQTQRAWEAVYEEAYIGSTPRYTYRYKDGVISPMVTKGEKEATNHVFSARAVVTAGTVAEYDPSAKPKKSIMVKKPSSKKESSGDASRRVTLCCGDMSYGVF